MKSPTSRHGFTQWLRLTSGRTFLSLRHRNFRLYFFGQLISNTGNWLTNVALTLLVLKITGSGFAIGLLAACQYGPILLLSPMGGAIADRADKRRMLLITQALEMAQSIGLAIMAFMPHPPLTGLYLLALCGGTVLSLDNPLRRSFVSEMVPLEDRPNAVVLYSTIVNTSRIFGPALAGLLVTVFGFGWCFALDACTYLAVIFCLAAMRPEELLRRPVTGQRDGGVREGVRYIASMPPLWISFSMLAAVGTLAYNFSVTLPLFVTRTLHGSGTLFTVLYSLFSCGAVASALVVANRGTVGLRHIVYGAAALGCAMLLLASTSTAWAAGPAVFLVGIASILYSTATTAIVQLEAKPEMHGRVLALQTVLVAGTTPIGAPLLGWLADTLSGRAPIIVGGTVSLLAAAFGYRTARKQVRTRW